MAPTFTGDLKRDISLGSIAQNPYHAPATPDSILRNLNDMQNHRMWCEAQASKLGRDAAVADRVADIISAGIAGENAETLNFMVEKFRTHCPHVTAEMCWIITTCDPEDEQRLFRWLANRAQAVKADDMTQEKFPQMAEEILRKVALDIAHQAFEEQRRSFERGDLQWGPGPSNGG